MVSVEEVRERFHALRSQALLFSNRDHIRALSAGWSWALLSAASTDTGTSDLCRQQTKYCCCYAAVLLLVHPECADCS